MKVKSLGRVRLLATSQTAAYQAPPSMGFSMEWGAIAFSMGTETLLILLIAASLEVIIVPSKNTH